MSTTVRYLIVVVFSLSAVCAAPQQIDDAFSIVLLPDTQFYSESYPQTFTAQTQWIVQNKDRLNIQFVIGEGDIVNDPTSTTEWLNANTSANYLDGIVPYAFDIGNHDYDNLKPSARGTTMYNTYFGIPRYSGYPWYLGSSNGTTNDNFYTTFTVDEQKYIVIALEYYSRNTPLNWMASVIQNNPDAKIIVVTHAFLWWDGTRVEKCDSNDKPTDGNWPNDIWNNYLRQYGNVMMVVNGHFVSKTTAHRTDPGVNGNLVHQIFTNFQDWPAGGKGYLRILTFHPSENRIDVTTHSVSGYPDLTTPDYQFSLPITSAVAPGTPGAVAGKVRSTSCSAIAGAQVSANGLTTTTDSTGHFTLPGLPAGPVSLTVTAPGYTNGNVTSTIAGGYETQQNFLMSASIQGPCQLNPTLPSVTICIPANNASVTSPVHVVAGAHATTAISYMQIYLDNLKVYQVNGGTLDTAVAMADGTHRLTVQAKDGSGVISKQTIYVNAGVTPSGSCQAGTTIPNVTICTPTNNSTVSSPVHITAEAKSSTAISYMQIYVDSVKAYQANAATLDTNLAMAIGSRRVTVQAKDAAGTITKQTIYVTVK
jgi:hypothetical protein